MNEIDDGGEAFPPVVYPDHYATGMSLRDYFAAQIITGMLARAGSHPRGVTRDEEGYAMAAYVYADAMLKERAK